MSIKKNKMSFKDTREKLKGILLDWALLAYTDISHPLAEYAEIMYSKKEVFTTSVMITGLVVIPDMISEELKSPQQRNQSTRDTIAFSKSESIQWEKLRRAATTNDPSVEKIRQLIINPMMISLILEAQISEHPLHEALKLITALACSENANEAAKLEAIKEGSADRFHKLDEDITSAMTRFTINVGLSLVNSKNAKHSPADDGLSVFMSKIFEENIKIKAKEMMRVIESYASKCVAYKAGELLVTPKMYDEVGEIEVTTDGDNQLIRYEISSILSGELKHSVSAASSSFTTRVSRERTKYKNKMNP